jgi:hypothetical protein
MENGEGWNAGGRLSVTFKIADQIHSVQRHFCFGGQELRRKPGQSCSASWHQDGTTGDCQ